MLKWNIKRKAALQIKRLSFFMALSGYIKLIEAFITFVSFNGYPGH